MTRIIAVMLFCLAALFAGSEADAHADAMTFLQALNNAGIWVYDATTAVKTGALICTELNTKTGDVVAAELYQNPEIYTFEQAATWVVAAVENLCPYQDHRRGMRV